MRRSGREVLRRDSSLRKKILIFCLAITIAALILQTLLYGSTSSNLIYRQAKEENLRTLENMQDEIHSYLRSIETSLLRLYNETDFLEDLRRELPAETLHEKWYRLAYNIGSGNFDSTAGVVALYLYNDDHEIISTYRRATTPKHNYPLDIYDGTQETNGELVKEYVDSDNAVMLVSSYYNEYREKDLVRFVVKLYQTSNIQKKLGYVVCDVDAKVLRYLMNKYTTSSETYIWLQPSGDRTVTSIGALPEEDGRYYSEMAETILAGQEPKDAVIEQGGHVFFQVNQTGYNLGGYVLMPQSLLEENQRSLNVSLLWIMCLMCLAAVVLSIPVARSLTRPLERVTGTMERIKKGETELRMTGLSHDEIGQLGQTFNEMLDQIESLVGREYEAKLMQNRAEYKALQAQINPHFLYNTLDTMSSIAELQDCPQVSALCQSLSNIFRYSLDMKNPFSTVAREIVHLKNYIYVMNVRMREEVTYAFDVEDAVLQDTLPRISIQPLVENAITHGLKNARGEKWVKITAKQAGENLQIIVEDNGVGISEARMQELLGSQKEGDTESGHSIGIANIHWRMKLLYGESYGVTIESQEGRGTRVSLTIPRRKMDEVELWKMKRTES